MNFVENNNDMVRYREGEDNKPLDDFIMDKVKEQTIKMIRAETKEEKKSRSAMSKAMNDYLIKEICVDFISYKKDVFKITKYVTQVNKKGLKEEQRIFFLRLRIESFDVDTLKTEQEMNQDKKTQQNQEQMDKSFEGSENGSGSGSRSRSSTSSNEIEEDENLGALLDKPLFVYSNFQCS